MSKRFSVFLEELERMEEFFDPNAITKLLKTSMSRVDKEKALKSYFDRQDQKTQSQIKTQLQGTEFSNLFKTPILTEGEVHMSCKKSNLDVFLEDIESVEVNKKPKFHSVYRLYEEVDGESENDEEENKKEKLKSANRHKKDIEESESEEDEEEMDEVKKCDDEDAEHEDQESDEDENDEHEDEDEGDDSDEEDKEIDENESEDEEDMEEDANPADKVLRILATDIVEPGEIFNGLMSLINGAFSKANNKATAQAEVQKELEKLKREATARQEARKNKVTQTQKDMVRAGALKRNVPGASNIKENDEEDLDEGSQGYSAGLKGVRKDAGAKGLKSGKNKVPPVKVQITGDKKLLKKPTTLKGDSYPKSSVAGASRPGAPKVKKS
jgi:hypothetical protein